MNSTIHRGNLISGHIDDDVDAELASLVGTWKRKLEKGLRNKREGERSIVRLEFVVDKIRRWKFVQKYMKNRRKNRSNEYALRNAISYTFPLYLDRVFDIRRRQSLVLKLFSPFELILLTLSFLQFPIERNLRESCRYYRHHLCYVTGYIILILLPSIYVLYR